MDKSRAIERARHKAAKTRETHHVVKENISGKTEYYETNDYDLRVFFEGKLKPLKTFEPQIVTTHSKEKL